MREKKELNIIHEDDFLNFLDNIQILDRIKEGKVKCKFCKIPVMINTIYTVFPQEKSIKVCCTKPECILEFSHYLNEQNEG